MTLRLSGSVLSWVALAVGLSAGAARATELVYTPVNPAFGGNPLNGPVLLNNAQAQNNKKDPDAGLSNQKTPLQQFNETLQRSILSALARNATGTLFNPDGSFRTGNFTFGDFTVDIVEGADGVLGVTTTDATGQSTVFSIAPPPVATP